MNCAMQQVRLINSRYCEVDGFDNGTRLQLEALLPATRRWRRQIASSGSLLSMSHGGERGLWSVVRRTGNGINPCEATQALRC